MTDRMFALLQAINQSGLDNSRWCLQGFCPWSRYMVNPTEDDELDMMNPHLSIIDIVTPSTSEIISAEPLFASTIHLFPPDERRYVGNGVYVNVWYLGINETSSASQEGGAK